MRGSILLIPRMTRVFAADSMTIREGEHLPVPAAALRPGDYLPPQSCLDATAWQDSGFPIGPRADDVVIDPPLAAGHVLLFGELGVLDTVCPDEVVDVIRPAQP